MKKKILGIFVCMLVILSISSALVVPSEQLPFDHDVGVYNIISPAEDGPAKTYPVIVNVTNYGSNTEQYFLVEVQIGEIQGSDWIIEYDDSYAFSNPIAPGEFVVVTFPDWTPERLFLGMSGSVEYKILACTYLDGDENPSNDCKPENFILDYWHDVGVNSIVSPEICISPGPQSIKVIVENYGTFQENGLTCTVDLYEFITDPEHGTLLYSDSYPGINLEPLGDTELLAFATYNFQLDGKYELIVCIPLANDDFLANNCLTRSIFINVDSTPPTTTHSIEPPIPTGNHSWYKGTPSSNPTVTLNAVDDVSGVKKTKYSLDHGNTFNTYSIPFTVSGCLKPGDFQYYSEDNCGNVESIVIVNDFKVDTIVPSAMLIHWFGIIWTLFAQDSCSGLDYTDWFKSGIPYDYTLFWFGIYILHIVTKISYGPLEVKVYDQAGNYKYDN